MEYVERLSQIIALHYERDVGLRSTLCTGDDGNTATAEGSEELTGDTGCMLHVFTHDGDSSQALLCVHWEHGTIGNLVVELIVQYLYSLFYILLAHTDRGRVLR